MRILKASTTSTWPGSLGTDRELRHDGRAREYVFADAESARDLAVGDVLVVDCRECPACGGTGTMPHDPMLKFVAAPECHTCHGQGHLYTVGVVTVVMAYDETRPAYRKASTHRPTPEQAFAVEDSGLCGRKGWPA